MWKAFGFTAVLLVIILGLTRMQSGHPGLDPSDQLRFERQRAERLRVMLETGEAVPPALACAASRASEPTVQTLYLVWLNRRADLTTVQDRDAAGQDLTRVIGGCGGDEAALESGAHRNGVDLQEAAALAMLKAGR